MCCCALLAKQHLLDSYSEHCIINVYSALVYLYTVRHAEANGLNKLKSNTKSSQKWFKHVVVVI